jgi:two-component system chemotaxis sensor kinase CheA
MTSVQDLNHLREIFVKESLLLGSGLAGLVISIDSKRTDKDAINELFQAMHTLKAASASVPNARPIALLAHECENILSQIRDDKRKWTDEMLPSFLDATDKILEIIGQVASGNVHDDDVVDTIERLKSIGQVDTSQPEPKNHISVHASNPFDAILVSPLVLDGFKSCINALISVRNQIHIFIKKNEVTNNPEMSQLTGIGRELGQAIDDLSERLTEVQKVPLTDVAMRARRVTSEISRVLNKKINIQVSGDDVKVHREVAQSLGRAIEQITRNACDHGIESPHRRIAAGKSEAGNIGLNFSVDRRGVCAEISDDGQGVDAVAVLARLKSMDPDLDLSHSLSDTDILNSVFLDGVSTATAVSEISGRGVGLSAARVEINKLNGSISLTSHEGLGTKFTINIPHARDNTVTRAVIAESDRLNYAFAIERVVDIGFIDRAAIAVVRGRLMVQFRGKTIPLGCPLEWKGIKATSPGDLPFRLPSLMLVLSHHGNWHGIRIDRILDQTDVTVKATSSLIKKIPGVRGICLTPSNEVAYFMDPSEFEREDIHD